VATQGGGGGAFGFPGEKKGGGGPTGGELVKGGGRTEKNKTREKKALSGLRSLNIRFEDGGARSPGRCFPPECAPGHRFLRSREGVFGCFRPVLGEKRQGGPGDRKIFWWGWEPKIKSGVKRVRFLSGSEKKNRG